MNRLISTRTRFVMDVVMGSALLLAPFFLPKPKRRYAAIPMLLGAAGLLTAVMTEIDAPDGLGFTPSRDLSEAVADPDNARAPYLRAHSE